MWGFRTRKAPTKPIHVSVGYAQGGSLNHISTTKYTWFTFLPLFLYNEFKSFSNLFFLSLIIVQVILPDCSPTGVRPTLIPLIFILTVAALKEIYEDICRVVSDRRVNLQRGNVFCHTENGSWQWESIAWCEMKVGQLVKVEKNEKLPADVVLISSSEPVGMAYIETANLDGESNLKIRQAPPITSWVIDDSLLQELVTLETSVECMQPTAAIYEFSGFIQLNESLRAFIPESVIRVDALTNPLGTSQLLPRGCTLRNTDWIFGVIVYAGKQTKLMMNSTRTITKRSRVDKMTNNLMAIQFCFLAVITGYSSYYYYTTTQDVKITYFPFATATKGWIYDIAFCVISMLCLYSGMIPISLYITLQMITLAQAYFIRQDLKLYDRVSDMRAEVRSSNLNTELGQIQVVLTDKTGTLTQNKMMFKMCSVGGVKYGNNYDWSFDGSQITADLNSPSANRESLQEFLTLLAVCHTVVPERQQGSEEVAYFASSPDEAALVKCARDLKFVFHTRTPSSVTINVMGIDETYEILNIIEFTSSRKRMSVIVKTPDGSIKLYIKGADSVIIPRLMASGNPDSLNVLSATSEHLADFAGQGYRTLCMGMTVLTEDEYTAWEPSFYAACTAIEGREKLVEREAEKIEKDLILLGATAIEDKLQDGAREAISKLLAGGMGVWVLTGDRLETAQNIGVSCGLIKPGMTTLVLAEKTSDETLDRLAMYAHHIDTSDAKKICLVVDGVSLDHVLFADGPPTETLFLASHDCGAVIFCRCSPKQKAVIVQLLKKFKNVCTLAIGDGANDVAMIQAADVGVGISGEEGMQASLSADYSIAQFRFLTRLLLCHGGTSYHRIAKAILYFFYKNVCQTSIILIYSHFALWSDTPVFDAWSIVLYNVFFASWPPLALGIFDRMFTLRILERHPQLYRLSQQSKTFNVKRYFAWLGWGILHAVVLFFTAYCTFRNGNIFPVGRTLNLYGFGTALNIALVVTVNLKCALETDSFTVMSMVTFVGSILMLYTYLILCSLLPTNTPIMVVTGEMHFVLIDLMFNGIAILYILFACVLAIAFDVLYKVMSRSLVRSIADEVLAKEFAAERRFDVLYEPLLKLRNLVVHTAETPYNIVTTPHSGFAFSQDEGAVTQADVVRLYNSTMPKKPGSPCPSAEGGLVSVGGSYRHSYRHPSSIQLRLSSQRRKYESERLRIDADANERTEPVKSVRKVSNRDSRKSSEHSTSPRENTLMTEATPGIAAEDSVVTGKDLSSGESTGWAGSKVSETDSTLEPAGRNGDKGKIKKSEKSRDDDA